MSKYEVNIYVSGCSADDTDQSYSGSCCDALKRDCDKLGLEVEVPYDRNWIAKFQTQEDMNYFLVTMLAQDKLRLLYTGQDNVKLYEYMI